MPRKRMFAFLFVLATAVATGMGWGLVGCGEDEPTSLSDPIAPMSINDLVVVSASDSTATLQWTAPGEDYHQGLISAYDIRMGVGSPDLLTDSTWSLAQSVDYEGEPKAPGSTEELLLSGLQAGSVYYFGVRARDDGGNESEFFNIASTGVIRFGLGYAEESEREAGSTYSSAGARLSIRGEVSSFSGILASLPRAGDDREYTYVIDGVVSVGTVFADDFEHGIAFTGARYGGGTLRIFTDESPDSFPCDPEHYHDGVLILEADIIRLGVDFSSFSSYGLYHADVRFRGGSGIDLLGGGNREIDGWVAGSLILGNACSIPWASKYFGTTRGMVDVEKGSTGATMEPHSFMTIDEGRR